MRPIRLGNTTRTPTHKCLRCGFELGAATGAPTEGQEPVQLPKDGDMSICIECGHLSIFLPGLEGTRELTAEEWADLKQSVQWPEIRLLCRTLAAYHHRGE